MVSMQFQIAAELKIYLVLWLSALTLSLFLVVKNRIGLFTCISRVRGYNKGPVVNNNY